MVGALTVLITIEVAVVCTYVQLCAEDYTWWCASASIPLYPSLIIASYACVCACSLLFRL